MIRKKTIEGIAEGEVFSVSRTFTEEDVVQFASISRDYNPIHFEDRFVKEKKMNGPICHGLLVAGMLTEIGGQIGWLASCMNFRFKKPVYFGDTITCKLTIADISEGGRATAEVIYSNQNQETVLEALLTGILPSQKERAVLKAMVEEGDPTNKIKE